MFWTKVWQTALAIGLLGMLAGGAAALGQRDGGDEGPATATAPRPVPAEPAPAPAPTPIPDALADQHGRERLAEERADVELMAIELDAQKSAIATLAEALATYEATGHLPDRPAPSDDYVDALHRKLRQQKDAYRERAVALERRKARLATPTGPRVFRPGDLIVVEVLEALPGRPISGQRVVRPDGTVGLDFYGDVFVAGLTRQQAKEKVVLHLRKFINDETLGLEEIDRETGKAVPVPPAETDKVFVDDSLNDMPPEARPEIGPNPRTDATARRLADLERKLDAVLRRLPAADQARPDEPDRP